MADKTQETVAIGADGQPNAVTPARNLDEAFALARRAEAKIHNLTPEEESQLAVAAVAVYSDIGFPQVRMDIPRKPEDMHDAFANCDKIYRQNGRIRRAVDTYVGRQATPFDHSATEEGDPIDDRTLRVYHAYKRNCAPEIMPQGEREETVKRMPLLRLVRKVLLDGWIYGNLFPWKQWYAREIDGETYELPYVKLLDPLCVFVDLEAYAVGHLRYYWKAGKMTNDLANRVSENWSEYIPRGLRGATLRGRAKELSLDQLDHLSYHKRDYQPYAYPPLLALLRATGQQEKLDQMDFALADGTISAIWLIRIGTDQMPALNPRHYEHARSVFNDPRRTMFCIVPHFYAIEVIQPNVDAFGPEKFEQSNLSMSQGLGLQLTGDPELDCLLMASSLEEFREEVVGEYIQGLYYEIAERNGFDTVPQLRWRAIELRRDYAADDIAYERGVMSAETYAARRGIDYALEVQRQKKLPKPELPEMHFSSPEIGGTREGRGGAKPRAGGGGAEGDRD